MPVFEDEHGTYILNSKDLRAVEHVHRLVQIGVDCVKIEGRTKSHYYTARTTQVYRQAIDDAVAGRAFRPELLEQLEGLANRGYTDGFYQRHHSQDLQNYRRGGSESQRRMFVGEIGGAAPEAGWAEVLVKNKFTVGDELELITPTGNCRFRLGAMCGPDGSPVREAPGGGHRVSIPLPREPGPMALLTRVLGSG
jgi:putative protease